jgi:hypothetical protein
MAKKEVEKEAGGEGEEEKAKKKKIEIVERVLLFLIS